MQLLMSTVVLPAAVQRQVLGMVQAVQRTAWKCSKSSTLVCCHHRGSSQARVLAHAELKKIEGSELKKIEGSEQLDGQQLKKIEGSFQQLDGKSRTFSTGS